MRILYFDCFSGISGDMVLGALVDAGLSIDKLRQEINKLNLKYKITSQKVSKSGISGTSIAILPTPTGPAGRQKDIPRTPEQVIKIIDGSKLAPEIKILSKKIFTKLAKAEAKIHKHFVGANCGSPVSLHLHELGSIDTIIDIAGAATGVRLLNIDKIYSSPLPVNRGYVKCAHGILPVPAPATAELIKDIPVYGSDVCSELVTPTGAAIVTTLAESFGKCPEMRIDKIGYGAGKKELETPNLLRVFIGELVSNCNKKGLEKYLKDVVTVVETNIDNMNPELYEYVVEKLFNAGALDVYMSNIQMKKNRPGTLLSVIAEEKELNKIIDIIFTETTTLGVRTYKVSRFKFQREEKVISTKYGNIKVKIGKLGNEIKNIAPEYESCKSIAEKLNIPLKTVYAEANRAAKYL